MGIPVLLGNLEYTQILENMLCSKPIIQIPDFEKAFIIQVDASEVGIGTVLLQEHDGKLLPVSFASRKLLPRERKYAIMEKECLAVVYAVQKYYEYLYGREFILQTDHQPLVCMNHSVYMLYISRGALLCL